MKLWPWSKPREPQTDGPPIPTTMILPDGTTVEGKWSAGGDVVSGNFTTH